MPSACSPRLRLELALKLVPIALLAAQAAAHGADDLAVEVERKGASFSPTTTTSIASSRARFLFFSYPIEVRLEVVESPMDSIRSQRVAGNLKRMTGRYELLGAPQGIELRYAGELEPGFALPPFFGPLAVRSMVEAQFAAMVAEIERRAAAVR